MGLRAGPALSRAPARALPRVSARAPPRVPRPPRRSRARVASRRGAPARVKRGTWAPDADDAAADDVHDDAGAGAGAGAGPPTLDLDAEEAEDTPAPAPTGAFEPGRSDGMARMPVPDITLETPRRWSPVAFAFLGDAVWELYVRRAFFAPPARPLDYDLKCKRAVRAEAQDAALRHLIEVGHFADEELRVVKWGRNASYGNVPTRLRGKGKGGHAIYRNASALECVVGYLYMTDMERLEATMARLGGEGVLEAVAKEEERGKR